MVSDLYDIFSTSGCAPIGACLSWLSELVLVRALGDLLIGVALLAVPTAAWRIIRRDRELRPSPLIRLGLGALGAIGASHLLAFLTLWLPAHAVAEVTKLIAMLLAASATVAFLPRLPEALGGPLEMQRRSRQLASEIGQRRAAEDALEDALRQTERRVAERTRELEIAAVNLSERERALVAQTQLMETTLDAIDHGICVFGPDGRLRAWNSACEAVTVLPHGSLEEGSALDDLMIRIAEAGVFGPGDPERLAHVRLEALRRSDRPLFEEQVGRDGKVVRIGRFTTPDRHQVFTLTDVTRQRRLEDELRAAKERWELASTGTNDGLFDWNVERGDLYLSPVWCRIVGFRPDELAPRLSTWRDLVCDDDREATFEQVERGLQAGSERLQDEHRLRHKDGHLVWVDARARVLHAPDGRPVRVVGTITDITDRRRTEEALRAGEERFRSLYNRTPTLMHSVDEDRRLLTVSDYWLERLGYRREEVIGRPVTDFMTPAARREVPARFSRLLADGIVRDLPYQFVTASGEVLDVLLSAIAERHPDGSFRQSLAVLSDVTELRRLERQLRESEERFEKAVSGSKDGIWDWDLVEDTIYFSSVWYELLGLTRRSGHQPRSFLHERVHPDDRAELAVAIEAHLAGGSARYEVTFRMCHADGHWMWVECKGKAVRDEWGKPYRMVGTLTDVTARKESEAQLKRYAAELHRSNQELEQFASVASHDLQEPLRMVIGYCELLQRRYQGRLDDDGDTFIEFAVDGARRMQGLINDLLTYSRVASRHRPPVRVDAEEAIEDALENLHKAIEETGARVVFGAFPAVSGDPSQLVQLFQNLIGNAIKYRTTAPPEIRIEGTERAGMVEFAIFDNGIGIEPRYAERIFEIFKRLHTRDAYPGSGIGLAICKRIVDRHGGQVWLDVGVTEGSCFRLTLPAADAVADVVWDRHGAEYELARCA